MKDKYQTKQKEEKKESEEAGRVIYRIKSLAEEYPYLRRLLEAK